MNIYLSNKKIKQINSLVEIVILKTTEDLEKSEKEILDSIFLTKKSFNVYFNSLNNRLYVSCLKLKSENIKTAFFKVMEFVKKNQNNFYYLDVYSTVEFSDKIFKDTDYKTYIRQGDNMVIRRNP